MHVRAQFSALALIISSQYLFKYIFSGFGCKFSKAELPFVTPFVQYLALYDTQRRIGKFLRENNEIVNPDFGEFIINFF